MSEEEIIEALNEIAARFREQHLYGYEHVVNAVALIVQQQAQIARVRELHRPCLDPHLHDGSHCCLACSDYGRQGAVRMYPRMYPCDTIRALGGDSDE